MYTLQSALYNLGLMSVDSKTMGHAIDIFIEKNTGVSGPVQFKSVLFEG